MKNIFSSGPGNIDPKDDDQENSMMKNSSDFDPTREEIQNYIRERYSQELPQSELESLLDLVQEDTKEGMTVSESVDRWEGLWGPSALDLGDEPTQTEHQSYPFGTGVAKKSSFGEPESQIGGEAKIGNEDDEEEKDKEEVERQIDQEKTRIQRSVEENHMLEPAKDYVTDGYRANKKTGDEEAIVHKDEGISGTELPAPYADFLKKFTNDEVWDIAAGRKTDVSAEEIQMAKEVISDEIIAKKGFKDFTGKIIEDVVDKIFEKDGQLELKSDPSWNEVQEYLFLNIPEAIGEETDYYLFVDVVRIEYIERYEKLTEKAEEQKESKKKTSEHDGLLKKFEKDEAQMIGDALGVDWSKVNLDEFTMGINVEIEHTGTVGGMLDPMKCGQIALDHLDELSDYYTRLEKMEGEGLQPTAEKVSAQGLTNEDLLDIIQERLGVEEAGQAAEILAGVDIDSRPELFTVLVMRKLLDFTSSRSDEPSVKLRDEIQKYFDRMRYREESASKKTAHEYLFHRDDKVRVINPDSKYLGMIGEVIEEDHGTSKPNYVRFPDDSEWFSDEDLEKTSFKKAYKDDVFHDADRVLVLDSSSDYVGREGQIEGEHPEKDIQMVMFYDGEVRNISKEHLVKLSLKKTADEGEMSQEEVKEETIRAVKWMRSNVNEWAVRDDLKKFTEWGFYKGDAMASIDQEMGREICDQLLNYLETAPDWFVNETYDMVNHYASFASKKALKKMAQTVKEEERLPNGSSLQLLEEGEYGDKGHYIITIKNQDGTYEDDLWKSNPVDLDNVGAAKVVEVQAREKFVDYLVARLSEATSKKKTATLEQLEKGASGETKDGMEFEIVDSKGNDILVKQENLDEPFWINRDEWSAEERPNVHAWKKAVLKSKRDFLDAINDVKSDDELRVIENDMNRSVNLGDITIEEFFKIREEIDRKRAEFSIESSKKQSATKNEEISRANGLEKEDWDPYEKERERSKKVEPKGRVFGKMADYVSNELLPLIYNIVEKGKLMIDQIEDRSKVIEALKSFASNEPADNYREAANYLDKVTDEQWKKFLSEYPSAITGSEGMEPYQSTYQGAMNPASKFEDTQIVHAQVENDLVKVIDKDSKHFGETGIVAETWENEYHISFSDGSYEMVKKDLVESVGKSKYSNKKTAEQWWQIGDSVLIPGKISEVYGNEESGYDYLITFDSGETAQVPEYDIVKKLGKTFDILKPLVVGEDVLVKKSALDIEGTKYTSDDVNEYLQNAFGITLSEYSKRMKHLVGYLSEKIKSGKKFKSSIDDWMEETHNADPDFRYSKKEDDQTGNSLLTNSSKKTSQSEDEKEFEQVDRYGRVIDRFRLSELFDEETKIKADRLAIGEEMQFTGTTVLKRVAVY